MKTPEYFESEIELLRKKNGELQQENEAKDLRIEKLIAALARTRKDRDSKLGCYMLMHERWTITRKRKDELRLENFNLKQENDRLKGDAMKFGRWLLKYAEGIFDAEGMLTWKHGDQTLDTHELYEKYIENPI